MTSPFALLPLALAVGNGRVDGFEAQQLVAAGITLLQRSAPLVRALAGRRSAILLPTSPAFLVALAASEGRAAVFINPLAASAEVAFQLENAGVGAVFTIAALAALVPAGMPIVLLDDAPRHARVLIDGATRDIDLGSHFGLDLEGDDLVDGRDEGAAIVYTSAMAGTPLGAVLTHRNLIANARSTIEAAANTRDDHSLALLPFSHLFGLTVSGVAPMLAGARLTTVARFNPLKAIDLLEREAITQVVGVPAVFAALVAALSRRGGRLTSDALRLCICGGAELSVELQDRWADVTGVELRQGYGLTEAAPVCLFNRVQLPNRRGTLGLPLPGVDVRICEPLATDESEGDPRELPIGEAGEICVRGTNVFSGYLHTSADATPWSGGLRRRGAWLGSGDRGVQLADGTIAFRGLIKPMFTRSGFNVYPRELERVIGAMPGVRAVEVHATPNPIRENDIAITVTGWVTPDEIRRWCASRLSAYKQPSEIEVVGRGT